VRDKTQEANQGVTRTYAVANDANTITCSILSRFAGQRVRFNAGDTYEIWKVSQALDQPGMGKSDLLSGLGDWDSGVGLTTPYADPHQVNEPCYSWNNTSDTGDPRNLFADQPCIKEGRDFFNEIPKPGYTPYAYPHPLTR
jgi:hypothetical protein